MKARDIESVLKGMLKDNLPAEFSTVSILRADETALVNGVDYLAIVIEAEQDSQPLSLNLRDYRRSAFGFQVTIEVQSSAKVSGQDATAEELHNQIYEILQNPNLPQTAALSKFFFFWIMPSWRSAIETDPDGRRVRTWETRIAAEEARA
jgi:hypothetical protein